MAKSQQSFNRWKAHEASTWAFRIFQKYQSELELIWGTHITAAQFTYTNLKSNNAQWPDPPTKHFRLGEVDLNNYKDLKTWSNSYNLFDNWVNLSVVLALASNLETYLASVISLALNSDPGVIFDVSKSLDGVIILKHGRPKTFKISKYIENCTSGDWSSRLSEIERLFGQCPLEVRSNHSSLEELRSIRNRIGHAFGRDIEAARRQGEIEILPMEKLTRTRANRLKKSVRTVAKSIDTFLLKNHIGEYEAVRFYQFLYPRLHKHVPLGQRAIYLKKAIGQWGAVPRGKIYCNGLVKYWESI